MKHGKKIFSVKTWQTIFFSGSWFFWNLLVNLSGNGSTDTDFYLLSFKNLNQKLIFFLNFLTYYVIVAKSCRKWGLKKEKSGVKPLILAKQRAFFTKNFEKLRNIKVHIFWEGHKILQNLHKTFLSYVVPVKSKVKISWNYVAFSEYMNFESQETRQILYGKIFSPQFLRPSRNISTLNCKKFTKFFPGEFFFTNFCGLLGISQL